MSNKRSVAKRRKNQVRNRENDPASVKNQHLRMLLSSFADKEKRLVDERIMELGRRARGLSWEIVGV